MNVIIIDFPHCLQSSLPPHTQSDQRVVSLEQMRSIVFVFVSQRRDKDNQHQHTAPAPAPVNLSDRFLFIFYLKIIQTRGPAQTSHTLIKSSLDTSSLAEFSCEQPLERGRVVSPPVAPPSL